MRIGGTDYGTFSVVDAEHGTDTACTETGSLDCLAWIDDQMPWSRHVYHVVEDCSGNCARFCPNRQHRTE